MSKLTGLRKSEEGKTMQKEIQNMFAFPVFPLVPQLCIAGSSVCRSLPALLPTHQWPQSSLKRRTNFHSILYHHEMIKSQCPTNVCSTTELNRRKHMLSESATGTSEPLKPHFEPLVLFRNSLTLSLTNPDISEKDFSKLNSERIMLPPVSKPGSGR